MTLVTVGVPTYNRPEGLRRTLECITRQTYKELEIIVSDNCTEGENKEKVRKVVEDFMQRDNRIVYYRQTKNVHVYNFQFVLEKSSADFFMWAADDDYWENDFIELCLQSLLKDERYTAAFTYFSNVDLLGHRFRFVTLPNLGLKTFVRTYRLCLEHESLGKANPFYALFRKKRLLKMLESNPIAPWQDFADVNVVMAAFFMGGISIAPKCCFYKTDPSFHSYNQELAVSALWRPRVITRWENRAYVQRLLLSALKNRVFLPASAALLVRCGDELYHAARRLGLRGYKFLEKWLVRQF